MQRAPLSLGRLGGAVDQRQSQLEPAVDGVDVSRACCFATWAMAMEQAFMAASSARVLLSCLALWLRDGVEQRWRGGDDDRAGCGLWSRTQSHRERFADSEAREHGRDDEAATARRFDLLTNGRGGHADDGGDQSNANLERHAHLEPCGQLAQPMWSPPAPSVISSRHARAIEFVCMQTSSRWLDEGEDGDGEVSSEQATGLRKKGASTEGLTAKAATVTKCYF